MIYIPFIYFSTLLIYILRRKKRIELSGLITAAYVLTSFFAIVIDTKQLYEASGGVKASIDLAPTLLYCLLISLTIVPFMKLPHLNEKNIVPIQNLKLFNWIVYFYIGIFVLFIFFFLNKIIYNLQNPDIAALRILIVKGEEDIGFSNYSGITLVVARLVFSFGFSAMYFHVFYFYSIAFLKRSSKFNRGILLFSLMPIMIGMLTLDRSKMIYWIMSFIAVAIFFWSSFGSSSKKQIKSIFIIFFGFFVSYLTIITLARYGEKDLGAVDSLIVYGGQSFNNFCLFYNKLHIPGISLKHVMPILNKFIGSADEIGRASLYNHTIDTNVFASFIGMLIREIGVLGSIVYSIIYFIVSTIIFKKIRQYTITNIFLVVILLYVPYLGIFGLYYGSILRNLSVWVVLILCFYLKKRYTIL